MNKNKGTFIVKVDNCQNGTWQGRVVWADENREEHFRSALELFRMIDGAVHLEGTSDKNNDEICS